MNKKLNKKVLLFLVAGIIIAAAVYVFFIKADNAQKPVAPKAMISRGVWTSSYSMGG